MIRTFIGCPDIHSPRPVWSPEAKSLGGLHGQSRRRHPRGEPPAGGRRPQRRRTVGNAFEARGAIDDVWRFSPEPLRVQAVPGFAPVTAGPAVRNRAPLRNTSSDQRIVAQGIEQVTACLGSLHDPTTNPARAENFIRSVQAACSYSRRMQPRRWCLTTDRSAHSPRSRAETYSTATWDRGHLRQRRGSLSREPGEGCHFDHVGIGGRRFRPRGGTAASGRPVLKGHRIFGVSVRQGRRVAGRPECSADPRWRPGGSPTRRCCRGWRSAPTV